VKVDGTGGRDLAKARTSRNVGVDATGTGRARAGPDACQRPADLPEKGPGKRRSGSWKLTQKAGGKVREPLNYLEG